MNSERFENVLLDLHRRLPHGILVNRAASDKSIQVLQEFGIPLGVPEPVARQAYSLIEFTARDYATRHWAWAIPNEDAIAALVRHSPIVEIGAGTGYWARMASDAGADIVAYDLHPHQSCNNVSGPYFPVAYGRQKCVTRHQDRTLFLCWPPYDSGMAYDCLVAYTGPTVIYVGEYGGCTPDKRFHARLERDWTRVERIRIPQWHAIRDEMYIFVRKSS